MKLAVFDLDGTLTSTTGVDGECFIRALEDTLQITDVNCSWLDYEHVTDSGIFGEVFRMTFGREPDPEDTSACVRRFVQLLKDRHRSNRDSFVQVCGANALLTTVANRGGWGVAIATGAWEAAARFKISVAGVAAAELPAAFAEDGPARESILDTAITRAADVYSEPGFDRVVSIGDAIWDLQTAQNLGVPFIGIADAEGAARLRAFGASQVIEDYTDHEQFWACLDGATLPCSR